MKPVRTIVTTLLVTGLASVGYARPAAPLAAQGFSALSLGLAVGIAPQQDEQKPKDTPDSKPSKTEEKPAKQQEPDKAQAPKDQSPKQDKTDAKQEQKDQKQDKSMQDSDKAQKDSDKSQPQNEDQGRDKNLAKQDQNEDRGHANSGRQVPDKDLKAHFGQEHRFNAKQVVTTTRIVPNQTQFVYTGYTFVFADPWPEAWAMDDDCYIDYVDGEYFLFDVNHPGVRIALTIVG